MTPVPVVTEQVPAPRVRRWEPGAAEGPALVLHLDVPRVPAPRVATARATRSSSA